MKTTLKLYFLIFIFFIFSTYNNKDNKNNFSFFFPIKKILIENNVAINLLELKSDFNFLIDTSLIFLNKEIFISTSDRHDFISSIQVKKKYPNTLQIKIIEKIPVAIQITNKRKFYITKSDEKINFIDISNYGNLPLIIGKHKNFDIFYGDLERNNFKINEIKAFYYFEIGRWDIVLKNEKIIKLPKNYLDLLPRINLMLNDNKLSKYKTLDFRIKDQLILQ
jgi:cell division protein FtsQ|tara:strand:+ start:1226 stop:1891 length:666 start_codon:yes stop_codon:yes gene_type:complete